jgi:hypothetical protein
MKKKFKILCTCLLLECFALTAASLGSPQNKQESATILINNRILARINGKTISTYDVAKKMDVLFYNQFPEYLSIPEARHQFYQMNWRPVLEELINKELILADAEEHKVEVTGGDTRQEMESLFGPNVHDNLDKVGITFDESSKAVKGDLIIRRMLNMRINSKALRIITPLKVREAYERYIQDPQNISQAQWNYRVVTIKDRNLEKTKETADKIYDLLTEQHIPLDQLAATLKEKNILGRKAKVTVSGLILNNEQELSNTYKEILSEMGDGTTSHPSPHKSRTAQATVYRIFYLKEKIAPGVPSFKEVEARLKDKLLNDYADTETEIYLNKLRQHYHVRNQDLEAMFPADYQPFTLK